MALSVVNTNLFLDYCARYYERLRGYSGTTYGMGESGDTERSAGAVADILAAIAATADSSIINGLYSATVDLQTASQVEKIAAQKLRNFLQQTEGLIRGLGISGVTSLSTYLAYYNTGAGGTWTALQNPAFRELYHGWRGAYPSNYNLFFEVVQAGVWRGTTYTNALAKFVVSGAGAGATTDGVAIDSTKYCGGIPAINVSSLTGNGVVTVTGTFFDPATGAVETSKTALFTITAAGHFYRDTGTPGTAATNALLIDVTTITIAAGITAGTFYVEAERPALRSGTCGADVVTNTTVGLDDSASSINDFYVGCEIATNADRYTKRTISDYDGTTKVATVSVAWATNPTASTSLFRVFRPGVPA